MPTRKTGVHAMFKVARALSGVSFADAQKEFDGAWKKADTRRIFGTNIEFVRYVRGLSTRELSARIGVDGGHLSRIQAMKANCSYTLALSLAQILKVSLQTLLTKDLKKMCEKTIEQADATGK